MAKELLNEKEKVRYIRCEYQTRMVKFRLVEDIRGYFDFCVNEQT